MRTHHVLAAAAALFASQATAQLVVGSERPEEGLWLLDVASAEWVPLVHGTGSGAWGLAADDLHRVLYVAEGTFLYRIPYDTLFPEVVSYFSAGAMTGLAFADGTLYGCKGSSPRGIYTIDPTTAACELIVPMDDSVDLGGLDLNPRDGMLYATADSPILSGQGLYRVDLSSGVIAFVSGYPQFFGSEGSADVDGLAISPAGLAFLVPDEPGDVGVVDLTSLTAPLAYSNPFLKRASFSGGAWAPGLLWPACAADVSGSADPANDLYGVRDGIADASDFFFFLDQFTAGNLGVADLTGTADPSDETYGVPNGIVDASDFFYFLDVFERGCP